MSCKLTLWEHGVGEASPATETFDTSRGVMNNDTASAYSTEGDCSNTSWGLFSTQL